MLLLGKKMIYGCLFSLLNDGHALEEMDQKSQTSTEPSQQIEIKNHEVSTPPPLLLELPPAPPIPPGMTLESALKARLQQVENENCLLQQLPLKLISSYMYNYKNLGELLVTEANRWWILDPSATLSDIVQKNINEMYKTFERAFDDNQDQAKNILRPYYTWQREELAKWFREQSLKLTEKSPVVYALIALVDDAYRRGVYLEEAYFEAFFKDINQSVLYEQYQNYLAVYLEKLKSIPKPTTLPTSAFDSPFAKASEVLEENPNIPKPPALPTRNTGPKRRAPSQFPPKIEEVTPKEASQSASRRSLLPGNGPKLPENFKDEILKKKLKPVDHAQNAQRQIDDRNAMEVALQRALEARRSAIAAASAPHEDEDEEENWGV